MSGSGNTTEEPAIQEKRIAFLKSKKEIKKWF